MKKVIALIIVILMILIVGCENDTEETTIENQEEQQQVSECLSYTTPYIKQKCLAVEALDMEMCDPITKYAFREDCIMIIAQLVEDQSQLQNCQLSENNNYQRTCEALIKQDVNHCFGIDENLQEIGDLQMRDCIELVAKKLQNPEICDNFVTHAQNLKNACGQTNSCHGNWIDGAQDHADDCKLMFE